MLVTVAAIVVAVFVASQRPTIIVVAAGGSGGESVAAVTDASASPAGASPGEPAPAAAEDEAEDEPYVLQAARLTQLPALEDPFHEKWDDLPTLEVPVEPQMIAKPMLEERTIEAVQVQAATDGRVMAWRLSWHADAPAMMTDTGRFSDAVAIQFPLEDGASFMMGGPDQPVQILYWKALWERDRDEGYQDVSDLYPNMWADLYWFAEGEHPFPIETAFDSEIAQQWFVAERAGNPQSNRHRAEPVEEMIAEGFGTLTVLPESHAVGHGQWRDGYWAVVIARPVNLTDDRLARRMGSGDAQEFAIAVWDGSADNVGGRKHWSAWAPFEVMP
ncbi:MAG: ethylbenzene dehydrogenase-related protein [Phycisphaeraceae bacterium]